MNYGEICILLLAVVSAVCEETDYCQANLCEKGKTHIACGNNGSFAHNCRKPKIVNMETGNRRLIVTTHNALRNKVAKGFKNFPPAKRMTTMLWDKELAKLAELNVKQCEMRHDQCRNTPRFTFVGQNLALTRWSKRKLRVSNVIRGQIHAWCNEYKYCPFDIVKSYKSSNDTYCDHFTALVQDKSNRIGCAILKTVAFKVTAQIMACNYAYGNILGAPVYSDGETTSLCTTGTNSRFTSLCSVIEI